MDTTHNKGSAVIWIMLIVGVLLIDQSFRFGETNHNDDLRAKAVALCEMHASVPAHPFTTDSCTLWPNRIGNQEWSECCVAHDILYWCGGTKEKRKLADEALRACINDITPGEGDIMYYGVRIGGTPYSGILPWRWGYGREYFAGYE